MPLPDPRGLGQAALGASGIMRQVVRTIYYDARAPLEDNVPAYLAEYWTAVDALPDTDLGWGALRGGDRKDRPRRQKGVDSLLVVDMLTNAFLRNYDVAVLIAGDEDFVPAIFAVRQFGVRVVVAGVEDDSTSSELRKAADRFIPITPRRGEGSFPLLTRPDGQYFKRPDS